jgi:hypothetical protein
MTLFKMALIQSFSITNSPFSILWLEKRLLILPENGE